MTSSHSPDLAMAMLSVVKRWAHDQNYTTKTFDRERKFMNNSLIAQGWTPPVDDSIN